jgi:signal transduction histidine kinase
MKLRCKFNLLALGVLLAVGIAISIAGVFTIERLAFSMNRKLMETEVVKVLDDIRSVQKVLTESGVATVDSYVRRAQTDILDKYRDYRFGRTGRMLIFGAPDSSLLQPQLVKSQNLDTLCLDDIVQTGRGFRECGHGSQKNFLYFAGFPEWHWMVVLTVDNAEMLAERNIFLNQVALILLAGLFFGLLAFAWFARTIAAPVQQLSEAALAISHGDWQLVLPLSDAVDEVGDLTRAFSQMSEHLLTAQGDLEKQAKALQNTNTRLHLEITEHQQAQEEIHRLNMALEQRVLQRTAQLKVANQELEAFAYSVSHDLRAPLRSIDGFSQALLDDYGEQLDDEGQEFLHRVRGASQRMAQLIDDLLYLSRITRGEMIRQSVDLSGLAKLVVQELQLDNPQRQVEMLVQPKVTAEGDPRLLRVVLENLLANAWKFTGQREQSRIEFGVEKKRSFVGDGYSTEDIYYVRDNGAGFDPAYADKLFGVFQRLHRVDEFPGTGIGLATVQRIIHRHGGRVWAEGEVGTGATFFFTL